MNFLAKWLFSAIFPLCSYAALPEYKVDIVVLGGGVGGLTSAVYLARGGLTPLVLQGKNPGGAIVKSKAVQNWPGDFETTGMGLIEKIRSQAEKNGAILSSEEMVSIDLSSRPFSMIVRDVYDTAKTRKIITDACIIAMGTQTRTLGVSGEKEYESEGVYTCAICDGPLYKNKEVAVVGGADSAILEADYLSSIAKKVYMIVRGDRLKGVETVRKDSLLQRKNVQVVYDAQVNQITGSKLGVEKIVVAEKTNKNREIPVDAVFLAIGAVPNTKAFEGQLELDSDGYILLKNRTETSVPGVFAVGDVTDRDVKQAVFAAGGGASAAIQAQAYLSTAKPKEESFKETIQVRTASLSTGAGVIEIGSSVQLQEIFRTSKLPILIDFYATWCSPCKYLSPFVDAWAKELEGKILVCKVNVEGAREVAALYGIRSMPTVIHMDSSGKEITRKIGPQEIISHVNTLK